MWQSVEGFAVMHVVYDYHYYSGFDPGRSAIDSDRRHLATQLEEAAKKAAQVLRTNSTSVQGVYRRDARYIKKKHVLQRGPGSHIDLTLMVMSKTHEIYEFQSGYGWGIDTEGRFFQLPHFRNIGRRRTIRLWEPIPDVVKNRCATGVMQNYVLPALQNICSYQAS